ncbi:unnamed protein product [Caenorhabditis auriculariae]|uniref:Uncharacterized protein n=1 Tax=Caenorhabditis auriculariae TaxID=2777116 RepID=A0A8S1HF50_9PELO|nr:unnamed protein product [Caenorhabditis auriculariae]
MAYFFPDQWSGSTHPNIMTHEVNYNNSNGVVYSDPTAEEGRKLFDEFFVTEKPMIVQKVHNPYVPIEASQRFEKPEELAPIQKLSSDNIYYRNGLGGNDSNHPSDHDDGHLPDLDNFNPDIEMGKSLDEEVGFIACESPLLPAEHKVEVDNNANGAICREFLQEKSKRRQYGNRKPRSCLKRIVPQTPQEKKQESARISRAYTNRNNQEIKTCEQTIPILKANLRKEELELHTIFEDREVEKKISALLTVARELRNDGWDPIERDVCQKVIEFESKKQSIIYNNEVIPQPRQEKIKELEYVFDEIVDQQNKAVEQKDKNTIASRKSRLGNRLKREKLNNEVEVLEKMIEIARKKKNEVFNLQAFFKEKMAGNAQIISNVLKNSNFQDVQWEYFHWSYKLREFTDEESNMCLLFNRVVDMENPERHTVSLIVSLFVTFLSSRARDVADVSLDSHFLGPAQAHAGFFLKIRSETRAGPPGLTHKPVEKNISVLLTVASRELRNDGWDKIEWDVRQKVIEFESKKQVIINNEVVPQLRQEEIEKMELDFNKIVEQQKRL